ncbi:MAG: restriction endonuclease subunit S [Alphaproteobacteria bacterium]|nr:restriction endonuclease subunit S [Alphaproteobacteria bacterium]
MLVEGWKTISLDEIAEVLDPQPDHRAPLVVENGFSYVGIGDISPTGKIRHEKCRKIGEEAVDKQEASFKIEYGDIGFGKVGTVGKVVKFTDLSRYAVSATLVVIKPLPQKTTRGFLYYLLQGPEIEKNISKRLTGTTRATLGIKQIRKFYFNIPVASTEQQKIAEILGSVDEAIAKTEAVISQTQKVKQGLLQTLLTKGIGHTKFKHTEIGEIPESWAASPLSELVDLKGGFAFKSVDFTDAGVQVIRMGNLYQSRLQLDRSPVFVPDEFLEQHNSYAIYPNDILMSMTGTVGKEDYGYAVIVPQNAATMLLNQRVCKLIPKGEVSYNYLLQLLWSRNFLDQLYCLPGGTKQANLSGKQILSVIVPKPSKKEQQEIGDLLNFYDTIISVEESKANSLKKIKSGLMSDLLTGRVRVNLDKKSEKAA